MNAPAFWLFKFNSANNLVGIFLEDMLSIICTIARNPEPVVPCESNDPFFRFEIIRQFTSIICLQDFAQRLANIHTSFSSTFLLLKAFGLYLILYYIFLIFARLFKASTIRASFILYSIITI